MAWLFETVLSNSLAACVLAAAAWVAARCRRPALAHVLWLLVLLKLCTPPLFRVQLGWLAPLPVAAPVAVELSAGAEVPLAVDATVPTVAVAEAAAEAPVPIDFGPALLLLWAAGSLLILVLIATRTRRLCTLLEHARVAPPRLYSELTILCRRLGIARAPELALVTGRVTPMLWASPWRARILLPEAMCAELSTGGMRALLAHELAHWKRRDHQVRWLELVCGVVFWWHPLLWCARRGLRSAEEDCCDAWVVWALPNGCRAYAEALVQTVQFLSSAPGPLPVAATGLGPVQDLNRRLTMIMKETTPRSLSRLGRILVVITAAAVLPTLPAFAQDPEHQKKEREAVQKEWRDNPEQIKAKYDQTFRHYQELVQLGRMEEAKEVQLQLKKFGSRIPDQKAQDPEPRKRPDGMKDDVFDALKKGVQALRERGDEAAAATLLHLMEDLAAKKRQGDVKPDGWQKERDGARADKERKEASDRDEDARIRQMMHEKGFDADLKHAKERKQAAAERDAATKHEQDRKMADESERKKAVAADEFRARKQGADQRVEELAQQVERLTKIVEQLAGQLHEEKKGRNIR